MEWLSTNCCIMQISLRIRRKSYFEIVILAFEDCSWLFSDIFITFSYNEYSNGMKVKEISSSLLPMKFQKVVILKIYYSLARFLRRNPIFPWKIVCFYSIGICPLLECFILKDSSRPSLTIKFYPYPHFVAKWNLKRMTVQE